MPWLGWAILGVADSARSGFINDPFGCGLQDDAHLSLVPAIGRLSNRTYPGS